MKNYRFIRISEVIELTSLSRSAIYNKIQENKFPSQIILGGKSVAWVEEEVISWMEEQIQNSRLSKSAA